MELITRATRGRPVERKPRNGEAPPVYPKGRTCSTRGCSHTLSIYNAGPECHGCKPERYRFVGTADELNGLMQDAA
jgi:hypothetical protein